ncbi:uncharacterized protein BcabD6B2_28600 [Babesia caballi]|uniref:PH domain-containing protein n=1 Tax=Babesia caballi TaxID=5871 RepID=A0AAV4LUJ7_BABCB|nr:hypothetical protein, conserved [Babesia caballi]
MAQAPLSDGEVRRERLWVPVDPSGQLRAACHESPADRHSQLVLNRDPSRVLQESCNHAPLMRSSLEVVSTGECLRFPGATPGVAAKLVEGEIGAAEGRPSAHHGPIRPLQFSEAAEKGEQGPSAENAGSASSDVYSGGPKISAHGTNAKRNEGEVVPLWGSVAKYNRVWGLESGSYEYDYAGCVDNRGPRDGEVDPLLERMANELKRLPLLPAGKRRRPETATARTKRPLPPRARAAPYAAGAEPGGAGRARCGEGGRVVLRCPETPGRPRGSDGCSPRGQDAAGPPDVDAAEARLVRSRGGGDGVGLGWRAGLPADVPAGDAARRRVQLQRGLQVRRGEADGGRTDRRADAGGAGHDAAAQRGGETPREERWEGRRSGGAPRPGGTAGRRDQRAVQPGRVRRADGRGRGPPRVEAGDVGVPEPVPGGGGAQRPGGAAQRGADDALRHRGRGDAQRHGQHHAVAQRRVGAAAAAGRARAAGKVPLGRDGRHVLRQRHAAGSPHGQVPAPAQAERLRGDDLENAEAPHLPAAEQGAALPEAAGGQRRGGRRGGPGRGERDAADAVPGAEHDPAAGREGRRDEPRARRRGGAGGAQRRRQRVHLLEHLGLELPERAGEHFRPSGRVRHCEVLGLPHAPRRRGHIRHHGRHGRKQRGALPEGAVPRLLRAHRRRAVHARGSGGGAERGGGHREPAAPRGAPGRDLHLRAAQVPRRRGLAAAAQRGQLRGARSGAAGERGVGHLPEAGGAPGGGAALVGGADGQVGSPATPAMRRRSKLLSFRTLLESEHRVSPHSTNLDFILYPNRREVNLAGLQFDPVLESRIVHGYVRKPVRSLDASHRQLSDAELGSFAAVWDFKLETVDLSWNMLTLHECGQAFVAFVHKTRVQRLYLDGNPLCAQAAELLPELFFGGALRYLSLRGCAVDEGVVRALKQLNQSMAASDRFTVDVRGASASDAVMGDLKSFPFNRVKVVTANEQLALPEKGLETFMDCHTMNEIARTGALYSGCLLPAQSNTAERIRFCGLCIPRKKTYRLGKDYVFFEYRAPYLIARDVGAARPRRGQERPPEVLFLSSCEIALMNNLRWLQLKGTAPRAARGVAAGAGITRAGERSLLVRAYSDGATRRWFELINRTLAGMRYVEYLRKHPGTVISKHILSFCRRPDASHLVLYELPYDREMWPRFFRCLNSQLAIKVMDFSNMRLTAEQLEFPRLLFGGLELDRLDFSFNHLALGAAGGDVFNGLLPPLKCALYNVSDNPLGDCARSAELFVAACTRAEARKVCFNRCGLGDCFLEQVLSGLSRGEESSGALRLQVVELEGNCFSSGRLQEFLGGMTAAFPSLEALRLHGSVDSPELSELRLAEHSVVSVEPCSATEPPFGGFVRKKLVQKPKRTTRESVERLVQQRLASSGA